MCTCHSHPPSGPEITHGATLSCRESGSRVQPKVHHQRLFSRDVWLRPPPVPLTLRVFQEPAWLKSGELASKSSSWWRWCCCCLDQGWDDSSSRCSRPSHLGPKSPRIPSRAHRKLDSLPAQVHSHMQKPSGWCWDLPTQCHSGLQLLRGPVRGFAHITL